MTDDVDKWSVVYHELLAMPQEKRADPDSVSRALDEYLQKHGGCFDGRRILPDRIIALACIKLAREWSSNALNT